MPVLGNRAVSRKLNEQGLNCFQFLHPRVRTFAICSYTHEPNPMQHPISPVSLLHQHPNTFRAGHIRNLHGECDLVLCAVGMLQVEPNDIMAAPLRLNIPTSSAKLHLPELCCLSFA